MPRGAGKGKGDSGGSWQWTWQSRQPRQQQQRTQLKTKGKSNSERSGGKYLACLCGNWSWMHRAGDACHKCGSPWGQHWFGPAAPPSSPTPQPAATAAAKPTVAEQVAAGVLSEEQWANIKDATPCLELLGVGLPKVVVAKVCPPETPTATTTTKDDLLKQLQTARARRIQADRTAAAKQQQLTDAQAAFEQAQHDSEEADKAAKDAASAEAALELAFGQKVAPAEEKKKEEPKQPDTAMESDEDDGGEPDAEMAPPGSAERRAYDDHIAATTAWKQVKRQRRQSVLESKAEEAARGEGNPAGGGATPRVG